MAHSTIIGLKDLRENMDKFISQVKRGKSFIVIKRSKPVFKLTPLDSWGDEGVWETVADLTKIDKRGIPTERILKYL